MAPADTPEVVYEVTSAFAFKILPGAFLLICFVMALSRTERPPYFAVFCIFGSMGAFCLSILFANGPISILGFFIAFIASPILLVRNWFMLRAPAQNSICHRIAQWASVIPFAILAFFITWQPSEDKNQAVPPTPSATPTLKQESSVRGSENFQR